MHTILVVEDDSDIRELICEVLGQAGYHVAEAGNGHSPDVRFALGDYDRSRTLVIDPVLSFSTLA